MDFDFSGIIPAIPGLWNGMVMTLKLMVMGLVGGIIIAVLAPFLGAIAVLGGRRKPWMKPA